MRVLLAFAALLGPVLLSLAMAEAPAPPNLLRRIWLKLHPEMPEDKVGIHETNPEHPSGTLYVARADQAPQEAALTAAVREALSQNRVIEVDAPAEPVRPALANLPSQPSGPLDSMPPVTATPQSMAPRSPADLSPATPPTEPTVQSSTDLVANPPSESGSVGTDANTGAAKNSPTVAAESSPAASAEENEPKPKR